MQSLGSVVTVIPYVTLLLLLAYNVFTCVNWNLLAQILVLWHVTGEDVLQLGTSYARFLAHSSFGLSNMIILKPSANEAFYERES